MQAAGGADLLRHDSELKKSAGRSTLSGLERSDKFKDECGVVAVHNHKEASTMAYLGLHQLQHRGQESAGVVSSNGERLYIHKAMGEVAEIFTEEVLSKLPGNLAIGHTRYSTA